MVSGVKKNHTEITFASPRVLRAFFFLGEKSVCEVSFLLSPLLYKNSSNSLSPAHAPGRARAPSLTTTETTCPASARHARNPATAAMADSVVPDDATAAPCLFPPARARRLRSSSSSLSSLTLFVLLLLSLLLFAFTPLVLSAQEEAAAAAAPPRDGGKKGSGDGGLVRREGGRFVLDDGSTFYVAGANCYYLVYSHGAGE